MDESALGRAQAPNVLVLAEEYDVTNSGDLARILEQAAGARPLIADFSRSAYLDSSALAGILRRKAAAGRDLRLVVSRDSNVRLIFEIAGLIDSLPIHADVAGALTE